jgi:hypothetical protein
MTEANEAISSTTAIKRKFSAEQVEMDCPARLQQISREIAERIEKAHKETKRAADHLIAVDKLLAEAKGLCDGGGFKKFRELFCPQLGKSQTYALLAIAAGKKTLAEHRTEERERKRKSRVNQKAVANSGTVPEKSEPEAPGAPTEAAAVEPASTATLPKKKPWRTVALEEARWAFDMELAVIHSRTNKRRPEHFSATNISVEILERLGRFLTDLAALKKSKVKPSAATLVPGDNAVSAELSAGCQPISKPA